MLRRAKLMFGVQRAADRQILTEREAHMRKKINCSSTDQIHTRSDLDGKVSLASCGSKERCDRPVRKKDMHGWSKRETCQALCYPSSDTLAAMQCAVAPLQARQSALGRRHGGGTCQSGN
jgi:hypothetical protein